MEADVRKDSNCLDYSEGEMHKWIFMLLKVVLVFLGPIYAKDISKLLLETFIVTKTVNRRNIK